MEVPAFLLRKLYKRGSLRQLPEGGFTFTLQNPIGAATIVAPPRFVVSGMAFEPAEVEADDVDLAAISARHPYPFPKGAEVPLRFPGFLLRGGNRIHVTVETEEFGRLDFLVEDRVASPRRGDEEE